MLVSAKGYGTLKPETALPWVQRMAITGKYDGKTKDKVYSSSMVLMYKVCKTIIESPHHNPVDLSSAQRRYTTSMTRCR